MSAIVTDQFRIFNAGNFVDSVLSDNNSYYVFLGLSNPGTDPTIVGFGRTDTWNSSPPAPTDNLQYETQYRSTSLFGKKVNSTNIRRVIRKVDWKSNTPYDMYRQDYSISNMAPVSKTGRLYDANYYVVNSDYNVYVCLDNGSFGYEGDGTDNYKPGNSKDEPTFTDLEPSAAGTSNDGYIWKYLFSISPSDIIKFDSTEYIVVPNDWETSTNSQIQKVREAGDSTINFNQIKTVYIADGGSDYINQTATVDILGDGTGAKASVTTSNGAVTSVVITAGGTGYTYGMVDLKVFQPTDFIPADAARLIVIIPPSRGHGYDIYKELGADRVLVYARFDDSTKDFPTDAKFAQVGIIKNPSTSTAIGVTFTGTEYSSLGAIKFDPDNFTDSASIVIGTKITQTKNNGDVAKAYVASYDSDTGVLKYYQDRSLYYNSTTSDQTDYVGVSSDAKVISFETGTKAINFAGGSPGEEQIEDFTGITTTVGTKEINLGVSFTNGLADPEINKTTGDVIYIDNRKIVTRDDRQKEDIKIILEF